MDNFHSLRQLLLYIENNYDEEDQLIIEDFMSYYINNYIISKLVCREA